MASVPLILTPECKGHCINRENPVHAAAFLDILRMFLRNRMKRYGVF